MCAGSAARSAVASRENAQPGSSRAPSSPRHSVTWPHTDACEQRVRGPRREGCTQGGGGGGGGARADLDGCGAVDVKPELPHARLASHAALRRRRARHARRSLRKRAPGGRGGGGWGGRLGPEAGRAGVGGACMCCREREAGTVGEATVGGTVGRTVWGWGARACAW